MKLGMTVLLAVVLLGLGVLFGVIFWENEEGTGVFSFSPGRAGNWWEEEIGVAVGRKWDCWGVQDQGRRADRRCAGVRDVVDDGILVDAPRGAVSSDVGPSLCQSFV